MSHRIAVTALGSALVDVLAYTDDQWLVQHDLVKGTMALIDEERAESLYRAMGAAQQVSGGAAANTAAGIASAGEIAAFIGRVKGDELGRHFTSDIRGAGVHYENKHAESGPATGRCLIQITPDAQRTMNTYLGAAANLDTSDLDESLIRGSAITFAEGFLLYQTGGRAVIRAAFAAARAAGRLTCLGLADRFCVMNNHNEFMSLLHHTDIVFANLVEAQALTGLDDLNAISNWFEQRVALTIVTQSEKGALIVAGEKRIPIKAAPVKKVVDTTGAGDLFASGFLVGLARGRTPAECGHLGALAASEIISHVGARPQVKLAELLK